MARKHMMKVLEEDRRPVPGVMEEKVKAWLENEVGKQNISAIWLFDRSHFSRNQNEWLQKLLL